MKIYIIKAPKGVYEDYCEPIVKVFANKEKAEEYVKIENAKLPLKQAERCRYCSKTGRLNGKYACIKPDRYGFCENYMKYYDIHPLFMEEYEVEE